MSDRDSQVQTVLRSLGVTPLEYAAMLCPYYEIPMGPRKMASWTVLEHSMCSGNDNAAYVADDYLGAINAMIAKGWLRIQGEETETANEPDAVPRKQNESQLPGAVVFTKKGYLLHRRIVRAIHGQEFVDDIDAFTVHSAATRELRFYARTARRCNRFLHQVQQRTSSESIASALGFPADIIGTHGPTKIGRWCPSEFVTHKSGYMAEVVYRRRRRRRFDAQSLHLASWVISLAPVFIFGTIRGARFSFLDVPHWRKPSFDDKDALFRWEFTVDAEPTRIVPRGAVLSGEDHAAGYTAGRNTLFRMEEKEDQARGSMLAVGQAQEIVHSCAERYLMECCHKQPDPTIEGSVNLTRDVHMAKNEHAAGSNSAAS